MARETRAVWEQRIGELLGSDLSDAGFAAERGVSLQGLQRWKWRLNRERGRAGKAGGGVGAKAGGRRSTGGGARSSTFVEMNLAMGDESGNADRIELAVDGIRVWVPQGFDEATLFRVISALRQVT